MRPARVPAALISTALVTAFSGAAHPQQGLPAIPFQVGQVFPDILLPSIDGHPTSIADFRGHKLILHVFASW